MFSVMAMAESNFISSKEGDHYVFIPEGEVDSVLVVAHGMIGKKQKASNVANKFLKRWINHAQNNQVILVVPVFDTQRFGNLKGGYGGYRNLIGKYIQADKFVNKLVDRYAKRTKKQSNKFYLYGHSAGGQFVARYVVTHPERVIKAVISAAGRYSYPSKDSKWPYGAGEFQKKVKWADGTITKISLLPKLESYAAAAEVLEVVVGGKDLKTQPSRPSHIGKNRIEFAQSWAQAMNEHASDYGFQGDIKVHIVPGVGHNSSKLTPKAVKVLFANSVIKSNK